ncbi:MAG TPA: putative Ig domain-containing protein, partial [Candidatus Sulfotelmatobacter sp.]|nr:putative Ig domain-containing protein [Candidatus Sulfotelmatobacter sp.]
MRRSGRILGSLTVLFLLGASERAMGATFYSQGSLAADSLVSWNSERDGSGTAPLDFASGDAFVIQAGHALITTSPWSVSGGGSELWIENGGALHASQPVTLAAASTLRVDSGGTYVHDNLAPFASSIFQAGTVTLAPASTVVLRSSDSTGPAGIVFGNLTLDFEASPGASVTLAAETTEIRGDLTLTAGTLALDPAGTLDVAGNWSRSSGNLQGNGGLVRLGGAGDQTVTGAAVTFGRLRIEKSGGRVLLADDLAVSDSLILAGGNIETGANRLSVGSAAIVARTSGHVVGRLEKSMAAGAGTQSFEIGDATHYSPVTVSGAGFTSAFQLTASTVAGDHSGLAASGIDPARSVNRTYTLASGDYAGGAFDLTLEFDPDDVDAGAQPAGFVVREFNGAWSAPAIGERLATSIRAAGLSGFGDFSIGEQGIDHYSVSASSPQDRGATFSTSVAALDALGETVNADTTTQVMMSSDGSVEYDADGNASFGDSVKVLSHGAFDIATRDTVAQTVTLLAGDAQGHIGNRSGLTVLAPLEIETASLPNAVAGQPYSQSASAAGGLPPYSWTLDSGTLPSGMSLSAAGLIAGTSTAAGSSGFT